MTSTKTKKGFTLVELLVTIVLLGIIGTVIAFNMSNISTNSKENDYQRFVAAVKSAASVYADKNPETFSDLRATKSFIYLKVGDIIRDGSLDEELKNPYTNEKIGFEEIVKVNLDSKNGDLLFEYPLLTEEKEVFLSTIADYIVWGEPYDCMQGAGSYELALSNEQGDLIMLDDEETIKKYNFTCSLPDNFEDYYDEANNYIGKYTKEAKTYQITYSWITESNIPKTATRDLLVLPKVTPTFRTNYEYDFTKNIWFTPEYNATTKKWKYLTYTPYIEGANKETTTFKITKQSKNPVRDVVNVTNGYINEYKDYPVDDGEMTYYIDTIIVGHHYPEYSYHASGEAVMRSRLIIPAEFITGESTDWTVDKNFNILDGVYSPVGISQYEFRLSNSINGVSQGQSVENVNTFNLTNTKTTKNITILNGHCPTGVLSYQYVFFRAINKNGYVGDWTPYKNIYITNQLDLLINTDSINCTSSNNCCLSEGNGKCYYTNKVKYLNYGGNKFVILQRYSNGNLLAALDGVSSGKIRPTSSQVGTWTIETCDGTYSTNYIYTSTVLQTIINKGNSFVSNLPSNYQKQLVFTTWPANYTSYVGNVDKNYFDKYKGALYESALYPYWTTTTFKSEFTVSVAHGDSTTKYSSYFYAASADKLTGSYAGNDAFVKPLLKFKTIYISGGNGDKNNPYKVCS